MKKLWMIFVTMWHMIVWKNLSFQGSRFMGVVLWILFPITIFSWMVSALFVRILFMLKDKDGTYMGVIEEEYRVNKKIL